MRGFISVDDAKALMKIKEGPVYNIMTDIVDNIVYHIDERKLSIDVSDRVTRENVILATRASGFHVKEDRGMVNIHWKTIKDLFDERLKPEMIEKFLLMRCGRGLHLPITITEALAKSTNDYIGMSDDTKTDLYLNMLLIMLRETANIRMKAFEGASYHWIHRHYNGDLFAKSFGRILEKEGFRIEYSIERMYVFWITDEDTVDGAFRQCIDRPIIKMAL